MREEKNGRKECSSRSNRENEVVNEEKQKKRIFCEEKTLRYDVSDLRIQNVSFLFILFPFLLLSSILFYCMLFDCLSYYVMMSLLASVSD